MATRSVFKLFSKTCSYSFTSVSSPVSTLSAENRCRSRSLKHNRSYSQPNHSSKRPNVVSGKLLHVRKISRSLQDLKENRYLTEEEEQELAEEEDRSAPRTLTDQTAREFKEKIPVEEYVEENNNPIFEVTDGYRSPENFFDVFDYMKTVERERTLKLFPHLQPSNIKPYGSNENLYFEPINKKKMKIVYPVTSTRTNQEATTSYSQYYGSRSDYRKESPTDLQEAKTPGVSERRSSVNVDRKRYSTSSLTARKFTPKIGKEVRVPGSVLSSNFLRRSNSMFLKKKKTKLTGEKLETTELYRRVSTHQEPEALKRKSTESFIKCDSRTGSHSNFLSAKSKTDDVSRRYNTYVKSPKSADAVCEEEYVTVKLSELQEECRKEKKCKPKKISFGKLPKMSPPDCPCIEPPPLRPGKPLVRLKKRLTLEPPRICPREELCDETVRADAGYVIKPKKLKPIVPGDCPCVEHEYVDFSFKRLPKRKIPEPPKICVECVGEECCPERSDAGLKVERKTLPKLEAKECPCVEPPPPATAPLVRLKPSPVKEPERVCPPPEECPPRADDDLVVEKKTLPVLKSECVCVEPPPMEDTPPLPRLKKKPVVEKPRVCPVVEVCDDGGRADKDLKVEQKRLPAFVAKPCPCVELEPPSVQVRFKRLKKRYEPKDKEKVCVAEEPCPPRADDGLSVQPKKLPEIKPGECPCVDTAVEDVPPLKRLVPKPVKEPPKICADKEVCPPREDERRPAPTVERKTLPKLPPGACPCVDPKPPEDVRPLAKLKKRPVKVSRVCPMKEEECVTPRADDDLKVKIKQLPKLEMSDCPCVEAKPPEDVPPLRRLKKKLVTEPAKVCPKVDDCDDIPRADEDDWLYWKRVEVKCEPAKTDKRSFSTRMGLYRTERRSYSTDVQADGGDLFRPKYDVAGLRTDKPKDKSYSIIIDIKPSAPLILTQAPVRSAEKSADFGLRRCRSEPVDCVTFVIYKNNNELKNVTSKSGLVKDTAALDGSSFFSTINRFISTCSTLYEKDEHLQPRKPLLKDHERFMKAFPSDEDIEASRKKSKMYYRTRKDEKTEQQQQQQQQHQQEVSGKSEQEVEDDECEESAQKKQVLKCVEIGEECTKPKEEKKLSLWARIVNYFKARPDCPSPEEFRKMRLREEAEKAASKAGLCLYDPKEMMKKNENEMPKVITAGSVKEEIKK